MLVVGLAYYKIMQKELNIKELKKERDQYLAGWKRERADFLNYKKEEAKRVGEIVRFSNQELILKILEILDNIYIAEAELPEELKENQWVRGILKIKIQILDFLEKQGVKEIKALGETFDPKFHEVVAEIKNQGSKPGTIIEENKRGYLLHNKVIRASRVKIAK